MKARFSIVTVLLFLANCKKNVDPAFCWECITTLHHYPPPSQLQVSTDTPYPSVEKCNMTENQMKAYVQSQYYDPPHYHVDYDGYSYNDATCKKK